MSDEPFDTVTRREARNVVINCFGIGFACGMLFSSFIVWMFVP